jgi:hypothetical protein
MRSRSIDEAKGGGWGMAGGEDLVGLHDVYYPWEERIGIYEKYQERRLREVIVIDRVLSLRSKRGSCFLEMQG